jgi:integrase
LVTAQEAPAHQGRIPPQRLLEASDTHETKGKRDHAILALLLGCGLRRAELIGLKLAHLQRRDDHWAIVDLFGKVGPVRTVPVPDWVKAAVDEWLNVARVGEGLNSGVSHIAALFGVQALTKRSAGGL